jgi:hypothetical protein
LGVFQLGFVFFWHFFHVSLGPKCSRGKKSGVFALDSHPIYAVFALQFAVFARQSQAKKAAEDGKQQALDLKRFEASQSSILPDRTVAMATANRNTVRADGKSVRDASTARVSR